jgi:hypothetical protein
MLARADERILATLSLSARLAQQLRRAANIAQARLQVGIAGAGNDQRKVFQHVTTDETTEPMRARGR